MKRPVLPRAMRIEPFDITRPELLATWLHLLEYHALEAIKAGEDAMRPSGERKLSDADAAYNLALGKRNVLQLITAAKMAIPPGILTPLGAHRSPRPR